MQFHSIRFVFDELFAYQRLVRPEDYYRPFSELL